MKNRVGAEVGGGRRLARGDEREGCVNGGNGVDEEDND